MQLRRSMTAPSLLAAGLLAAGCGAAPSAAPSATPNAESLAQMLPAAQAAANSAQSVHVAGTVLVGAQADTINMSLAAPQSASGSFSQAGNAVPLRVVDGNYYVQITTGLLKFAKVSPPDCGTVCGKWIEVPASDVGQVAGDFTIRKLFQDIFGTIPSSLRHDTADTFEPTTYQGQPALKASFEGGTMVVARGSKPYILDISNSNGDHVVFSEWNSVPPITAPPASDVVSPGALGGL